MSCSLVSHAESHPNFAALETTPCVYLGLIVNPNEKERCRLKELHGIETPPSPDRSGGSTRNVDLSRNLYGEWRQRRLREDKGAADLQAASNTPVISAKVWRQEHRNEYKDSSPRSIPPLLCSCLLCQPILCNQHRHLYSFKANGCSQ
jgi:hypothetical protein